MSHEYQRRQKQKQSFSRSQRSSIESVAYTTSRSLTPTLSLPSFPAAPLALTYKEIPCYITKMQKAEGKTEKTRLVRAKMFSYFSLKLGFIIYIKNICIASKLTSYIPGSWLNSFANHRPPRVREGSRKSMT